MIKLHQSNRLERLLALLGAVLAEPPAEPLAPEMIVVQNPGMARWLLQQIALQAGIAANFVFPLPARFAWQVFASQLGEIPEQSDFERSVMQWRILGLLPELRRDRRFAEVAGYLRDDRDGRKAFQLAGRLSDLFDQYLVFRPDMLIEWEEGRDEQWQAELWRRLTASNRRHRARLVHDFRQLRRRGGLSPAGLPRRICFFGISSLAPVYLELVDAVSALTEVHLLHLSPCRHYWGDLASAGEMARKRAAWRRWQKTDVSEYFEAGNPLLASLGTAGQEFFRQLVDLQVQEDEQYVKPAGQGLLARLQGDILDLVDRTEPGRQPLPPAAADRSVQFHVCHSPLREIEVLHDRLLDLFTADPDLKPADILVMAPDIETYAPAVAAVFGAAAGERRIPWSLADRSFREEQSLVGTFLFLLDLPTNRCAAPAVLSLLETPAVRHRFGVEEEELARLRDWLRESGIRWGLDAGHRRELGLEMSGLHTWSFGLDRLLLGYIAGAAELCQGIAPCAAASGSEASLLGSLAAFVDRLRDWHGRLREARSAGDWTELLLRLLDDFFAPAGSEDEQDALLGLRATIVDCLGQCQQAGFTGLLSPVVIKDCLEQALAAPSPGQAFLSGRVTFCNMVPMRSVPFRVIWLLGMNDGDYPRNQRPVAFDLMAGTPRPGDRNRRNDDRYLFLEALLSARQVLAISWVGRDRRDNSVRPPSVVVAELQDYIDRSFSPDAGRACQQLTVEHPLQPFSPRCFDGSPGRASYAEQWLPLPGPATEPPPFLSSPLPPAEEDRRLVEVKELVRFWSQPVRFFLQERLGLRLRAADEILPENEPFLAEPLQRYVLGQEAVTAVLAGRGNEEQLQWLRATGALPHGSFGVNLFHELAGAAAELAARVTPLLADPVAGLDVAVEIDGFRLSGRLDGLYGGGCVCYRAARLKGRDLLRLWLQHLVLNLLAPRQCALKSCHVAIDRTVRLRPVADPRAELRQLLELYLQGQCEPLRFFPETSRAWQEAWQAGKGRESEAAQKTWTGDFHRPGEGEDPAYRIAFKGDHPLADPFPALAQAVFGPLFAHLEDDDADL